MHDSFKAHFLVSISDSLDERLCCLLAPLPLPLRKDGKGHSNLPSQFNRLFFLILFYHISPITLCDVEKLHLVLEHIM